LFGANCSRFCRRHTVQVKEGKEENTMNDTNLSENDQELQSSTENGFVTWVIATNSRQNNMPNA
jgi:hypothetical protein